MVFKRATAIVLTQLTIFVSLIVVPISATNYQECLVDTSCQIGEFLYDDSYLPISDASCTLNVTRPNGSGYLNNISMLSSNGWYYYSFTPDSTVGIYPTQLCCSTNGEYLCIDKTFEVTRGNLDTADAVWNNAGRTNFLTEIWNYSSDSLGSFGSKITSTLQHSTNTDDETSQTLVNLEQSKDLLSGLLSQNRELLDQLVNAPLIQNFIPDENQVPLSEKVESASSAVNQAYSTTQTVKAMLTSLLSKWSTLTATKIDAELTTISGLLGTSADQTSKNTLMGALNILLAGWENPIITTTADAAGSATTSLQTAHKVLFEDGLATSGFQDSLIESLAVINTLEGSIGSASDSIAATTLYGFLRKLEASADSFGTVETDIDSLIKTYDQFNSGEIADQLEKLQSRVLGNNQVRGAEKLLLDPINPDKPHPKSTLYGLKAIIALNRSSLASSAKNPISLLWLQDQDGTMLVRGFIYNPSDGNLTREVKYLLPIEVLAQQVVGKSESLTVDYSTENAGMLATGNYSLSGKELVTFYVQFQDLWTLSSDDLDTYAKQANDLTNSWRRSAQYAQATSIKSDIEVTLDKMRIKLNGDKTPDARIQSVREAQLDLLTVQEKMDILKGMVTDTTSAKSIVGAVGGIQAVAVWGLILIFVAGFVFLVVFMRRMQPVGAGVGIRRSVIAHPINLSVDHNPLRIRIPRKPIRATDFAASLPSFHTPSGKLALTIVATIGLATVVVNLIQRTGAKSAVNSAIQTPSDPKLTSQGLQFKTDGSATPAESVQAQAPTKPTDPTAKQAVLGTSATEMLLKVGPEPVTILGAPLSSAKSVMTVSDTQFVYVFEVKKDSVSGTSYSRIGFSATDNQKAWWVETSLLSSPN